MPDLSSTGTPSGAKPVLTKEGEASQTHPSIEGRADALRFDSALGRNMFLGSVGEHALAPAHGIQVAAIVSLLLWIAGTILLWWIW